MGLRLLNSAKKFKILLPKLCKIQFRGTCEKREDRKVMKGLVLGMYEKDKDGELKFTPSADKFEDRVGGKLSELVKEFGILGTLGKGKIFCNLDPEYRSIAVVGLGKEGLGYCQLESLELGMENVRVAAGIGARFLQKQGCSEIHVDAMEYPEQAAEGASLAVYHYQDNRRKIDRYLCPKLELYESPDVDAWTRGLFKAEAQNLARRLTDTPANQMTPTTFAQATVDALCPCGVSVEIRNMDWIEANRLDTFLAFARGSCEPPLLLEITYSGAAPDDRPVLLVGKGITFNSGGINLRPRSMMSEYRGCMAGAAVVVGAIRAAAALSLPLNIQAIIPLCENMPSGMSVKPGDVIKCLNGKTIAVERTDRAGVVVLADPLLYGQATYKPKLIVDVATLGQGMRLAIGGGAAGVFTSSDYLWTQFKKAGSITGDRVWRMPLFDYYRKQVTNHHQYDIRNVGNGEATSCLAAAILHEFVPCADWCHLDIRGVGMLSRYGSFPYLIKSRMTGRPTRTLIQFLFQLACAEKRDGK